MVQRYRVAFERVFGGAVISSEWLRHITQGRSAINEAARPLLTHARQNRLDDARHAEKIYVAQIAPLCNTCLFNSSKSRYPGIVHHRINALLALKNALHR